MLLEDSFARIVAAIRQGRAIYDNICKATCFVFAVHVPIVALALIPALLHWPVLLLPVHIVLLELLIDPACSVVFEAEPPRADLMTRPPRAIDASPFSRASVLFGLMQGTGVAMVLIAGHFLLGHLGADAAQARSASFIALVVAVFLLTLANRDAWRQPGGNSDTYANPWIGRMALGMTVMLVAVIAIAPLRRIMGLAVPDGTSLMGLAAMLLACLAWLAGMRWMGRKR